MSINVYLTRQLGATGPIVRTMNSEPWMSLLPYRILRSIRYFSGVWIKSPDDPEDGNIRKAMPNFPAEHLQNDLMLVNAFKPVAARCRAVSSAQIALAWVLPEYPDYTNLGRLENVKSVGIMLKDEDVKLCTRR
ncbi:predicted protein [Postia placenta Mad-698-R]|nr:predicted protein [Postia placenta Mad-698-R]